MIAPKFYRTTQQAITSATNTERIKIANNPEHSWQRHFEDQFGWLCLAQAARYPIGCFIEGISRIRYFGPFDEVR